MCLQSSGLEANGSRDPAELFRLSNDFCRAVSDLCVQTSSCQLAIVVLGALEIGDARRRSDEEKGYDRDGSSIG